MKRAILAIVGTVSGLILLLSFKTHSAPASTGARRAAPSGTIDQSAGTASGSGGTDQGTGGSSSTRTVTGDSVGTRWGPVQVRVTLNGKKITDVQAVQVPDGNPRDVQINNFAVPQLIQEALQAQSAQIDNVSGATVTTGGFVRSLQSALDRAGQ